MCTRLVLIYIGLLLIPMSVLGGSLIAAYIWYSATGSEEAIGLGLLGALLAMFILAGLGATEGEWRRRLEYQSM